MANVGTHNRSKNRTHTPSFPVYGLTQIGNHFWASLADLHIRSGMHKATYTRDGYKFHVSGNYDLNSAKIGHVLYVRVSVGNRQVGTVTLKWQRNAKNHNGISHTSTTGKWFVK